MKLIELDASTNTNLIVFLLRNVRNVNVLRAKILSGELDCSAVKSSLLVNSFHLIAAANKAAISQNAGKLATKCLNTELLFNLSPSKNISQSLSKFGLGDEDENVAIAIFQRKDEAGKFERMQEHFAGEICDIDNVSELTDVDLVKKTYNITDTELKVSELVDSVVSRIATKEFGSF